MLQSVQSAIATDKQQSSVNKLAVSARISWRVRVKGSLLLGTDSHLFCSAITFAMTGASFVSADDVNRGSTSRKRPRNLATSVR